jgi:lipopolysaccharide export system permease protein
VKNNYPKPQFGIINLYLFREVLINFGVCIFIFIFTVLMSQVFTLSELIINKGFSFLDTGKFILYLIPSLFVFIIPMSLLLGILFTLGRMSTDGEIIAFKASGISLSQIFRPILIVAVFAYLITSVFSVYLSPWANYALKELAFNVAKTKAHVGIKERIFNSDFDGLMVYVNRVPAHGKRLEGVLISDTRETEEPATIVGEEGYLIPNPETLEITLQLQDGSIHRLNKKTNTYQKIDFQIYDLNLDLEGPASGKSSITKKRKEMSMPELLDAVVDLREKNEHHPMLVELHSRFAIPFGCLVFSLFAVPLGVYSPRAGKSYGFVISLMVILIYYILFSFGENLGRLGVINPIFSMWIPNLLFLFLSMYLFKKAKTESSLLIFEELAWYIQVMRNKFRDILEGPQPEESDHNSTLSQINTASEEELMVKFGIGRKRAESIISYREAHGSIESFEELKEVPGIGEKTFARIKESLLR